MCQMLCGTVWGSGVSGEGAGPRRLCKDESGDRWCPEGTLRCGDTELPGGHEVEGQVLNDMEQGSVFRVTRRGEGACTPCQ